MIVHISSQHRVQQQFEVTQPPTSGEEFSQLARPSKLDLRRSDTRGAADLIVAYAAHLPEPDRVLLTLVFGKGMQVSQLARAHALDPRVARRKVRALAARVLDPRFAYVLARKEAWPASRRRVATACIIEGLTLREAAKHLRMSLYRVRELRNAIEHGYEESKGLRRALGGAA